MRSGPYCLFPRTPFLFSSLNVQKNMLQDKIRLSRFKEAIFQTVQPGDVVIDLGTGTGILAIWAAQAGAKKVYAIEESDVADVTEEVVRDNGYSDKIFLFKANSQEVVLPEKADVLIAELVGHFFFEEGIVEYVADVRDNLLKNNAKIIPSASKVFLAPADIGEQFNEISFWKEWNDPSLMAVSKKAANTAYVESVRPENLLATGLEIFFLNACSWEPEERKIESEFVIERPGNFNALVGWFELTLHDHIKLSTSPHDDITHWQQCIFPLDKPIRVSSGDCVPFFMSIQPFTPGSCWEWGIKYWINGNVFFESHKFEITYTGGARLLKERF